MAQWRSGAVAQWRSGAVAQWRSGAVAQWRSGAVAQWRSGAVAQWRSGAVAQWRSGAVAQWRSGAVAQWRSGAVAQWRSGAVAQWRSGAVAQWRSGAVAQWRSGAVAQWRSGGAVAQWRSGAVAQWRSGYDLQIVDYENPDMNPVHHHSVYSAPRHSTACMCIWLWHTGERILVYAQSLGINGSVARCFPEKSRKCSFGQVGQEVNFLGNPEDWILRYIRTYLYIVYITDDHVIIIFDRYYDGCKSFVLQI